MLDAQSSCVCTAADISQQFYTGGQQSSERFLCISCFWTLGNLISYRWRWLHLSLIEQEEAPGRDGDLTRSLPSDGEESRIVDLSAARRCWLPWFCGGYCNNSTPSS